MFDGGHANLDGRTRRLAHRPRAAEPPAAVANAVVRTTPLARILHEADRNDRYGYVLHLGIGGSDWGCA